MDQRGKPLSQLLQLNFGIERNPAWAQHRALLI